MTHTLLKDDVAEITRRPRPSLFPPYHEVRRRIERNRRGAVRPNPCALIALPEDAARRPVRKRRPNMFDGKMRGQADHGHEELAWPAMESAWDRGELSPGRDYTLVEIRQICRRAYCDMESLCLDLAEHRARVVVTHVRHNTWRFSARFGEARI